MLNLESPKQTEMLHKSILIIVALLSALVSGEPLKAKHRSLKPFTTCQNKTTIRGTIPEATLNGRTVILTRPSTSGYDTVATTIIKEQSFAFEALPNDTLSYYEITIKGRYSSLIILEGGTISVNFPKAAKGGRLNEAFAHFIDNLKTFEAPLVDTLERILRDEDKRLQVEILTRYHTGRIQRFLKLFEKNPHNALGLRAAHMFLTPTSQASAEQIDTWRRSASPFILSHPSIQKHLKRIDAIEGTSTGKIFKDISGEDVKGGISKLSDFVDKGHYVLIDFWASWCGPCRRSMPLLKSLYKEYKPKGLEIVGVAVWDERDAHLKATQQDELPWPQIYNKDEAAAEYGVTSIPHIMLIAPDGTIVERDLHDENKIKEVLKRELVANGNKL